MTVQICPLCLYPLATSIDGGCVPGSCNYRPPEGTPEHKAWMTRRTNLPASNPLRLECASV